MNKNLQEIDQLFIQFLENHKEEPGEKIWMAIENDLNRVDAEKFKTKYTSMRKISVCLTLL